MEKKNIDFSLDFKQQGKKGNEQSRYKIKKENFQVEKNYDALEIVSDRLFYGPVPDPHVGNIEKKHE